MVIAYEHVIYRYTMVSYTKGQVPRLLLLKESALIEAFISPSPLDPALSSRPHPNEQQLFPHCKPHSNPR